LKDRLDHPVRPAQRERRATKAIRVLRGPQAQSAQQVQQVQQVQQALEDRLAPLALKALRASQEILKTWCNHSARLEADWLPDDTVLPPLGPRMVCTACGLIGADVRPDWSQHTKAVGPGGAHQH
jgi:hypothetical protein